MADDMSSWGSVDSSLHTHASRGERGPKSLHECNVTNTNRHGVLEKRGKISDARQHTGPDIGSHPPRPLDVFGCPEWPSDVVQGLGIAIGGDIVPDPCLTSSQNTETAPHGTRLWGVYPVSAPLAVIIGDEGIVSSKSFLRE